MKRCFLMMGALVLALAANVAAHEQPGHLVLNGDVTASIRGAAGERQVHGRMNGYLVLGGKSMEEGARIEALNVALFGVDQATMTGKRTRGKPTGVVGFSAAASGEKRQSLRYDPDSRSLVGEVAGRIDMPQFTEMSELRIDPELDYVELPTVEATIDVRIDLGKMAAMERSKGEMMEGNVEAAIGLRTVESADLGIGALDVSIASRHLRAQIAYWQWIEVGRRLCIQPVRIFSFGGGFPFFFHFSGDGLPFGRPGNDTQWAKADVVFTYRDWITLFQPQFSTFDSSEAGALLGQVDVDDCIEVFFVDRFSPQALWGGGATFGLGQASSKVISSDENADFGVDLTHLAHEIGHVVGLPHPTAGNISSTNTLMCPSGFNNDNPKRNSRENEDNLSNPLLTFTLKLLTAGPDCQQSADCGACP